MRLLLYATILAFLPSIWGLIHPIEVRGNHFYDSVIGKPVSLIINHKWYQIVLPHTFVCRILTPIHITTSPYWFPAVLHQGCRLSTRRFKWS